MLAAALVSCIVSGTPNSRLVLLLSCFWEFLLPVSHRHDGPRRQDLWGRGILGGHLEGGRLHKSSSAVGLGEHDQADCYLEVLLLLSQLGLAHPGFRDLCRGPLRYSSCQNLVLELDSAKAFLELGGCFCLLWLLLLRPLHQQLVQQEVCPREVSHGRQYGPQPILLDPLPHFFVETES